MTIYIGYCFLGYGYVIEDELVVNKKTIKI